MTQSENGGDKDFVLSSDYQGQDVMASQEDSYYESASGTSGAHAFKHIYIRACYIRLIIDNKYLNHFFTSAGRVIKNVVPLPYSDSAFIVPF